MPKYQLFIPGPTPNGAYAIIFFKDADGMATSEENAVKLVINEYNSNGQIVNSIYADAKAKKI